MLKEIHRFRAYVVMIVFITSFGCLAANLFNVQVLKHDFYYKKALEMRTQKIRLYPNRGNILDRNGKILAMSKESAIACFNPSIINDPEQTKDKEWLIREVARILDMDIEKVRSRANRTNSKGAFLQSVWVERKLSDEEQEQLEDLVSHPEYFIVPEDGKLPEKYCYRGISFQRRKKRVYPNGSLLCHVLGFVQNQRNPDLGVVRDDSNPQRGIELMADTWLTGKPGYIVREKDQFGRGISDGNLEEVLAEDGADVVLTIDRNVQYIVENTLRQAINDHPCSAATVLVTRAKTGEILALANYPDYDPNDLSELTKEQQINIAVEYVYEPGSILKAITGLIALDEGLVNLNTMFDCENGSYHFPGVTVRDSHRMEMLTFLEVIAHSSNIGICKATEPLGNEKLYNWLLKFGFKKKTGCGLDAEVSGLLDEPEKWWVKLYQVPFGQGISVTPIQMMMAFSVIVNDGFMVKPYIIKQVQRPDGLVVVSTDAEISGRIVMPDATRKMRKALEAVTTADGTAPKANVKGYTEGGKTGTAQVAEPGAGYTGKYYNSSFIGYAPAKNPEIIVLVTFFNTRRPYHYGGTVAAPVFRDITAETLQYLTIAPDDPTDPLVAVNQIINR